MSSEKNPRTNLKGCIMDGVREHLDLVRIKDEEVYACWVDLYDNYERYKQEDDINKANFQKGLTTSWKSRGIFSWTKPEIADIAIEERLKCEASERVSDSEYFQQYVDRVRSAWSVAMISFQGTRELAASIVSFIRINKKIPCIGTDESDELAIWLYTHRDSFWVPISDADMWQQLQNIYNNSNVQGCSVK
ncbi:hypothetical protein T484DRAFT_1758339 [Baffinella frigidus]|nr:hypothetical protein T484DRAFT_1758339 [Cryptophyta sp. CCMP2293]